MLRNNNIHNSKRSSYNFIWHLESVRWRISRFHYHRKNIFALIIMVVSNVNWSLAYISTLISQYRVLLISLSSSSLLVTAWTLHFLVALRALSQYLWSSYTLESSLSIIFHVIHYVMYIELLRINFVKSAGASDDKIGKMVVSEMRLALVRTRLRCAGECEGRVKTSWAPCSVYPFNATTSYEYLFTPQSSLL